LDKISHLQGILKDFTVIFTFYVKIWIFGLIRLWFFSVEKVFSDMKSYLRKWKMKKKIKANLDQKLKFSYKERNWRWNLWRLLAGLKSYQIGLTLFSTVKLSLHENLTLSFGCNTLVCVLQWWWFPGGKRTLYTENRKMGRHYWIINFLWRKTWTAKLYFPLNMEQQVKQ
jgi:hypothetical protein